MSKSEILLDVRNISVSFKAGRNRKVHAVSNVSFRISRGETLGLVGESGCGKSTVARAIMQLPAPCSGRILLSGEDLTRVSKKRLRRLRPRFQMIFQDSISSLNPRRKVGETIATPLKLNKKADREERTHKVLGMMTAVGIAPDAYDRRPFRFSGGQCQRIQIARALMAEPELLICDEPVSSLDVSVQAQIINLLESLREQYHLTMLFISHDLSVVKAVCDRVAVMYLGKLCEEAPSEKLYLAHRHPYTGALLGAIPKPNPKLPPPKVEIAMTEISSSIHPPPGCRFHTRCLRAENICAKEEPAFNEIEPGHKVACHFPKNVNN